MVQNTYLRFHFGNARVKLGTAIWDGFPMPGNKYGFINYTIYFLIMNDMLFLLFSVLKSERNWNLVNFLN